MEFVIGDEKLNVKVKLTLETNSSLNEGMIYLKANGKSLMGLKNGKYRLFSNASNEPGLVMENLFIVQDQTL